MIERSAEPKKKQRTTLSAGRRAWKIMGMVSTIFTKKTQRRKAAIQSIPKIDQTSPQYDWTKASIYYKRLCMTWSTRTCRPFKSWNELSQDNQIKKWAEKYGRSVSRAKDKDNSILVQYLIEIWIGCMFSPSVVGHLLGPGASRTFFPFHECGRCCCWCLVQGPAGIGRLHVSSCWGKLHRIDGEKRERFPHPEGGRMRLMNKSIKSTPMTPEWLSKVTGIYKHR